MTNPAAAASAIDLDLTGREVLLLAEIRTATAAGRIYPNPLRNDAERNTAIDVLTQRGLLELVQHDASGARGWVAVRPPA
jgi:hypothetical protein